MEMKKRIIEGAIALWGAVSFLCLCNESDAELDRWLVSEMAAAASLALCIVTARALARRGVIRKLNYKQ